MDVTLQAFHACRAVVGGSVPSERLQNYVLAHHRELYSSVVRGPHRVDAVIGMDPAPISAAAGTNSWSFVLAGWPCWVRGPPPVRHLSAVHAAGQPDGRGLAHPVGPRGELGAGRCLSRSRWMAWLLQVGRRIGNSLSGRPRTVSRRNSGCDVRRRCSPIHGQKSV